MYAIRSYYALEGGFLHGDGTRPAVLRELDPKGTDVLLCLRNNFV